MADERIKQGGQGTFAHLYDVQEQLSKRDTKPIGRPRKKIQRKPTTIRLTQLENRMLSKLHLLVNDQISISRSELVGVAIETLSILMEKEDLENLEDTQIQDIVSFRKLLFDFIKLKS